MRRDLDEALARTDLPADTMAKIRLVRDVLDRDPQARLESFWIEGDRPYAVIAFGDPDAADLVAYLLHGIDTDLGQLPGWADAAQRLCADVIRSCVVRGEPRSIATIAWFGWDSGTHATALATTHATLGAARLSVDIDRLVARNPRAHIAVVTYSYSSTLLGEMFALNLAGAIRTAVSIASAGVTRAAGLAIEAAISDGSVEVYATEGAGDSTAPLGRLGRHPVDPRELRGVTVYDCDGGEAPGVDGSIVEGVGVEGHASQTVVDDRGERHPGYFDAQGQGYLTLVSLLADAATR
ncbi:alpha/beta hydrolase [Microbacterium sp.]|uniref:alpha/beta hydrolase n=1 Tax=Microbacterium sp. TaxID=51671 RepID=UPI0039E5CDC1